MALEGVALGHAGRWRLVAALGAGGMGEVFRAEGPGGEVAAVKILAGGAAGAEAARRFEREARVLLSLRHANLVGAYEAGRADDGRPFLAMELLEGESLAEVLARQGALSAAEVVRIGRAAAAGIGAAHAAGIVHRDVKPGNLFACADGTLKVLDFGLALPLAPPEQAGDPTRLTRTGMIVGTPSYMAPEQASGGRTEDARTDVWALGAVMHHALAGRPPFWADGHWTAELVRILTEPPDPLPRAVPAKLAAVLVRALRKDAAERFQTMTELSDALTDALAEVGAIAEAPTGTAAAAEPPGRGVAPVGTGPAPIPPLAEELRLVSVLLADGVAGAAALAGVVGAVRRHGGAAAPLRGGTVVGVFGGAEWTGDEATSAVRAALLARDHAARIGVGTGKARVRASGEGAGAVTGAALRAAADALAAAAAAGGGRGPAGGAARPASIDAAADTAAIGAVGGHGAAGAGSGGATVGACPETQRRIHGGFEVEGARVRAERAGRRVLGVREVGGAEVPFLGRARELGRLTDLIGRARDEGRAQAALVVGPPGIGKSRLRFELQRWLEAQPQRSFYFEGRGEAARTISSNAAMLEVVRTRAKIPEGTPHDEGRAAIEALVAAALVPAEKVRGTTDFVGELLGVRFPQNVHLRTARADPQVMADRTRLAVGDLFEAFTQQGLVVLAIEDLHWVDAASSTLVEFLLVRLQERPFVVVATARPELFAERPDALPGAERIDLRELSQRDVAAIVERILGDASAPPASGRGDRAVQVLVQAAIVDRAGGNPYFAEELA
ncbi:MAG TPA: protein kinase, partial [Myxococcota bacterium]|nr:protein kinase [Myxococcota bacterium]